MTENIDELVEKLTNRILEKLQARGLIIKDVSLPMDNAPKEQEEVSAPAGKAPAASEKSATVKKLKIKGAEIDLKLAHLIDHTLLKPDATQADLEKVCDEAKQYHFATVCVNSNNIPYVAELLKGSDVKPIAVVGFPLGAAASKAKAFEAKEAIKAGAQEIDMVINLGALKSKDYQTVLKDIEAVVEAAKPHFVKAIIETSSLNEDEKIASCVLAKAAGAHFVKTSTGFGAGGATVADVKLMRRIVGDDMLVKASGGIRTKEDAEAMLKAGANRIGASTSVAIVSGKKAKREGY